MSTKHDPHFKQEAIHLALSSDQTYRQTADDLGIKWLCCINQIQDKIFLYPQI